MTNVAMLQTAADLSASIIAQGVSSLVPAGVVMAYAGATAPTGWLLCEGAAISRTTYAALFSALSPAQTCNTTNTSTTVTVQDSSVMTVGMSVFGTGIPTSATISSITNATTIVLSAAATATNTGISLRFGGYGTGDGSTTFNLPDYRGRFIRGRANGSANDPDRASRTAANTGGNTGDAVGSVQTNSTKANGVALSGTTTFATSAHTHGPGNYRARIALSGSAIYMERDTAASYNPTQQSSLTVAAGSGSQTVGATLGGASDVPSATGTVSLSAGDNETRPLNAYVNYIIKI